MATQFKHQFCVCTYMCVHKYIVNTSLLAFTKCKWWYLVCIYNTVATKICDTIATNYSVISLILTIIIKHVSNNDDITLIAITYIFTVAVWIPIWKYIFNVMYSWSIATLLLE